MLDLDDQIEAIIGKRRRQDLSGHLKRHERLHLVIISAHARCKSAEVSTSLHIAEVHFYEWQQGHGAFRRQATLRLTTLVRLGIDH